MQHRDEDQPRCRRARSRARAACRRSRKLTGPDERDREEARDEDPRQRLAQQVDQVEREHDRRRSTSTVRRIVARRTACRRARPAAELGVGAAIRWLRSRRRRGALLPRTAAPAASDGAEQRLAQRGDADQPGSRVRADDRADLRDELGRAAVDLARRAAASRSACFGRLDVLDEEAVVAVLAQRLRGGRPCARTRGPTVRTRSTGHDLATRSRGSA